MGFLKRISEMDAHILPVPPEDNKTTLSQCFEQYALRFPGKKNIEQRKKLARFVEVSYESTAAIWLRGAPEPVGSKKWKAIVFFSLLGYNVSELRSLRPLYRDVIYMMALHVVSDQDIYTAFHFVNKQPASRLFDVINHNQEVKPMRMASIEAMVSRHQDDLTAAKDLFLEAYQDVLLTTSEQSGEAESVTNVAVHTPEQTSTLVSDPVHEMVPVVSVPTSKNTASAKGAILQSLAAMVQAMLPLAKMVVSDTFTKEDRVQLRELSGGEGVFNLSNLLEQLCSESARKEIRGAK
jgi:hypothetical protein